jgi:dTDP-4-amino-4,6-dideoxygalactose transaminase
MNSNEKIPFLDLVTPHLELEEELVDVFRSAVRAGRFIGGNEVDEFEREFAQYCGADYCVGVGSGTDALRFALIAAGVNPGETVITVPNTFIATTEAITQAGAAIGFVDIDERTHNMDPAGLKGYLETRCKMDMASGRPVDIGTGRFVSAVIPVHLYGQMADMDPIMELAERYKLIVVEDACQAHGAEYFSRKDGCWKKAGSIGHAAAFSFYPGKNLGACGEGGAVTTRYQDIARKVGMLRDHGQSKKYYHEIEGYNGRLDAIQAGILRRKLMHLPRWNEGRRKAAARYGELLKDIEGVAVPYQPDWARCVYHLYVIRIEERDALRRHLADNSIDTGLHYPVPLHLQDAYANFGFKENDFPVSEKAAGEMLSIPMYPGLTISQQQCVADGIRRFVCQTV